MHRREEIGRLYDAPANRRLKYWALAAAAVSILLMAAIGIWIGDLPRQALLLMRGFAGVFAIVFVILVGILAYRVNTQYLKNRER